jgi:protein SCO1/2
MDAVAKDMDINRIFISVDPARDTPQSLSDYVSLYEKGLIGLTGTSKTVDAVAKQWNIFYSFNKANKDDKNYTVDHTIYMYLTDKNGKPMAMIRPEATPEQIIHFIKENNLGT